jgi:hypothetical protein
MPPRRSSPSVTYESRDPVHVKNAGGSNDHGGNDQESAFQRADTCAENGD